MAFVPFKTDATASAAPAGNRPAPVEMNIDIPGVKVVSADVVVFGGDKNLGNGEAEAMLKIEGIGEGGYSVTSEVGRFDPALNSPRIKLTSVWAYAEKHGLLLYRTERQSVTSHNEIVTTLRLAVEMPAQDRTGGGFKRPAK